MYFSTRFQSELRLMTSVYQQVRTNLKKFCENKSFVFGVQQDAGEKVSMLMWRDKCQSKLSKNFENKNFQVPVRQNDFENLRGISGETRIRTKCSELGVPQSALWKFFEKIWKDFECTAGSWPKTFELKTFKGQWGRTISKSFERILPGGSSEFFLAKCSELGVPLSALKKKF